MGTREGSKYFKITAIFGFPGAPAGTGEHCISTYENYGRPFITSGKPDHYTSQPEGCGYPGNIFPSLLLHEEGSRGERLIRP